MVDAAVSKTVAERREGSNPSTLTTKYMLPSTGVRPGLIILGDRLDGLERQGSNPWGSTIFSKNRILK